MLPYHFRRLGVQSINVNALVPFLIRYPKRIDPGSARDAMVLNIDVAPTLLEPAGVEPVIPMQGVSFVPLLRDADAPWRDAFLAEYFLERIVPRVPTWQAEEAAPSPRIHHREYNLLLDATLSGNMESFNAG